MDPTIRPQVRSDPYAVDPAEHDLFASKVRLELSRVLASSQFKNSKRLQDFLAFSVESVLQGNVGHLKESLIGVQVFERQPGFDPKQDPVVRVTAHRLRERLDEFYSCAGEESQVLIRLAKGSYIPTLVLSPQTDVLRPNVEPIRPETKFRVEGRHEAAALNPIERLQYPVSSSRWQMHPPRSLLVSFVAGSLAVVLLLGVMHLSSRDIELGVGPVSYFNIDLPAEQELRQDYGSNLAFSSDGRSLAYVAVENGTARLFVRGLSESESHAVPDSEGASAPLFSPDGEAIVAYVPGHLRRFFLNGSHIDLAPVSRRLALFGSAWDGSSLLFDDAPPEVLSQGLASVYRMQPGSNEKPVRITSPPPGLSGDESQMIDGSLPDGRGYLISVRGGQEVRGSQEWIGVVSPAGFRQRIVANARGGIYLPTGHLAFWSNGNLQVAPMSLSPLELTGPQVTALKNVGSSGWEGGEVAVSPQGTLAYVKRSSYLSDRQLVWVDRTGQQTPLPIPPAPLNPLSLSPNGKNLLLARYDRGEQEWTLWNYSFTDGSSRQLTEPSRNPPYACWSPDGRFVVYESNRMNSQASNLFLRSSTGGPQDPETQITWFKEGGMVPYLWSKDGRWVLGTRGMLMATKSDIFAVSMSNLNREGRVAIPIVQTPGYDNNPDLSPDGKWLAYQTEGRIFVRRFPGSSETTPILIGDGEGPLWDPSGCKLFFRRGRSVMQMSISTDPTLRAGEVSALFASDSLGPDLWIRNALLSPDGKRFLMLIDQRDKTEGHRINIIENWFAEVKNLFHPQAETPE